MLKSLLPLPTMLLPVIILVFSPLLGVNFSKSSRYLLISIIFLSLSILATSVGLKDIFLYSS